MANQSDTIAVGVFRGIMLALGCILILLLLGPALTTPAGMLVTAGILAVALPLVGWAWSSNRKR